jgi:diguanylate cyclase (GGDEF)-like protein/PAS domain S-box-containing protein
MVLGLQLFYQQLASFQENIIAIKILIVEDESEIRQELVECLTDEGFDCVEAFNGEEGLNLLRQDLDITIVLSDIIMPRKSGLEMIKDAQSVVDKNRDLELIIMTGHGGVKEAIEALKLGILDFIQKPIDLEYLVHVVRRAEELIGLKRASRQYEASLEKRVAELIIANENLSFQNKQKEQHAAELAIANEQKEQHAAELAIANEQKEQHAAELAIANEQKEQHAAELVIAGEVRIAATVFESHSGMFVTDSKNCILRVNKAFSRISGYSAEEVIGQSPNLLSSGRKDKELYRWMWYSINATDAWEGEVSYRHKSGDIYPGYLAITAVKDANGMVSNYVATFKDITISKAASAEIESLAYYDPLTALPNRRLLLDRLGQALAASARSSRCGALLFLDLDDFKTLNDTLGHEAGDKHLQYVATRLTGCIREEDTVARLGGDEFVVVLEGLSEKEIEAAAQTQEVAEKIKAATIQPDQLGANKYHSTFSIGATIFNGHKEASEELLKQADIAMYQAKAAGSNTMRFFDHTMQESITVRADMENELRQAIEHHQFQVYYQIQVDHTGQALGAEALIRWQHPERGMISPIDFIPLAEEVGLILPIGQWVLDTACVQLNTWQQNPLTQHLVLAVNVSTKQFHQDNFVEQVLATIARHDINPVRLKLELTESILVRNISDIITKMTALSKIGISFSLDDFGTGYSSLQYLKKLPFHELKIDQLFVRDLVNDASDKAIVRNIITLAHNLKLTVTAEGVETEEQRQFLLDSGCTYHQGCLFSMPVPIDEFEALLE